MKALILKEYNNFVYEDVPSPQISADEVLIEVKACGICGSDVHGMDGSTGRRQPPIVMGHEASGVIAETGENVTGWKKGDRVTFDSTVYCGKCYFCRKGQINLCDNRRVLGVACDDYRQHGAFAEYVAVPQHILYRLPDKITFARASMVEALSNIRRIAEECGMTMPEIALKWALSGDGISCSLVGARNINELEANVKAALKPLPGDIIEELNIATEPLMEKLGRSFDYYGSTANDRT